MAAATTSAQGIQEGFTKAGFVVSEVQPGKLKAEKAGCVAYLELDKVLGRWLYSGPPYLVVRGIECELEDRGYQKFWYSRLQGKRFPIRKVELEIFHRFDEEVRYLTGQKTLYHQSLGSINARTVYDRVMGRPDR